MLEERLSYFAFQLLTEHISEKKTLAWNSFPWGYRKLVVNLLEWHKNTLQVSVEHYNISFLVGLYKLGAVRQGEQI